MSSKKLSLIGAGNIGGASAFLSITLGLFSEIVLIDKNFDNVTGKALDLKHASVFTDKNVKIKGASDTSHIKDSDLIIISAGKKRTKHMSREDLLKDNAEIIKMIAYDIKKYAKKAFVIIITNPVDILTHYFLIHSGFSSKMVVGMGSSLDTARLKSNISKKKGNFTSDNNSMIFGNHSNDMSVFYHAADKKGISDEELDIILQDTKDMGAKIVQLTGSSAYYSAAAAAIDIARSYILDQNRTIICSRYIKNAFYEVCTGVPVTISKHGAKIVGEFFVAEKHKERFIILEKLNNKLLSRI